MSAAPAQLPAFVASLAPPLGCAEAELPPLLLSHRAARRWRCLVACLGRRARDEGSAPPPPPAAGDRPHRAHSFGELSANELQAHRRAHVLLAQVKR